MISRWRLGWQWVVTAFVVIAGLAWAVLCLTTGASAYLQYRANRATQQEPQQALADLQSAIRLRPDLASPRQARAELLFDVDGNYAAARGAASAALQRNPRDWQSWQLLASINFEENHLQRAQRDLQNAERYDQGFAGHYQLANFAILMGDQALFWKEVNAALAKAPNWWSHYALSEILTFASGPNDPRVPTSPPAGRPFVGQRMIDAYVSGHFWDDAATVLKRMRCPTADQIAACQWSAAGLVNAAFGSAWAAKKQATQLHLTRVASSSWDMAVKRGWLPQVRSSSNLCADGNFQEPFAGPTVGWAVAGPVTVAASPLAPGGAPGSLLIGFDGQEPQQTTIVQQYVPVEPGHNYELSFQSRSAGEAGQGGLALQALAPGWKALASAPAALSGEWTQNQTSLAVPNGVNVVLLRFFYKRPLGEVRLQAPVMVGAVRVAPIS